MLQFDRAKLEELAVEKLQWNPREALMATTDALTTALVKKGNVSWATIVRRAEIVEEELKEPAKLEAKLEARPEAKPEIKPETKLEVKLEVKQEAKPAVKLPLDLKQQIPLVDALENFDTLFANVQSELHTVPSQHTFETPVDPPALALPPPCVLPCTTHDIAVEITSLKKQIADLDIKLQRRRMTYLIMCFDPSGVFTSEYIESYKSMLDRNESEMVKLRETLQATSARMHDAGRVRQATGDRMFALDLIDKNTLSQWEKFNRDLQMQQH